MAYPYDGEIYDQIATSRGDLSFWSGLVSKKPGSVLELGVGTGRIALELAALATDYHGVDSEPSMLAVTAKKAHERGAKLTLHLANFTSLALGRTFDFVFIPANTVSHVVEEAEAAAFFAAVRNHCVPGGRFVIDTYNPRPWRRGPEPYEFGRYIDPSDGLEVVVWSAATFDAVTQVATHELEFRKGARIIDRRRLRQRSYSARDLTERLRAAGFENVQLYGNYSRDSLTIASPRLIALAG